MIKRLTFGSDMSSSNQQTPILEQAGWLWWLIAASVVSLIVTL
jgi:hypothetical protein